MEALGTLAGGIAHDFNNILAAVLGYAELVQGEMLMGSPQWLLLQRVLTAGLRAKALVLQILAFSHRTPPAERTLVSLADVLRKTLPFLRALLPATIAIEAHLTPEASLVLADATERDAPDRDEPRRECGVCHARHGRYPGGSPGGCRGRRRVGGDPSHPAPRAVCPADRAR